MNYESIAAAEEAAAQAQAEHVRTHPSPGGALKKRKDCVLPGEENGDGGAKRHRPGM
jgi:hypothetical protein